MVVKLKTFLSSVSPRVLTQDDFDALTVQVNAFIAAITPQNLISIEGEFAPGGRDNVRSTYVVTVIYIE